MALEHARLAGSLVIRLAARIRIGALDPVQTARQCLTAADAVGEQDDDVGKLGGAAFRIRRDADIALAGFERAYRVGVMNGGITRESRRRCYSRTRR